MDALKLFEDAMKPLDIFKRGGDEYLQLLKKRLEDSEENLGDAKAKLAEAKDENPQDTLATEKYQKAVDDCEEVSQTIGQEINVWRREFPSQAAIARSTAFECFLRDFLVQRAVLEPQRFQEYLCEKGHLSWVISDPLEEEEVYVYLEKTNQSFQNMARVEEIYGSLFGKEKNPFGKCYPAGSAFPDLDSRSAALIDIRLLWQIRHQIVHRNGEVGYKYNEQVQKICDYRSRLGEDFLRNYPVGIVPGPRAILASEAKDNLFGTKLEEFADSLIRYAQYAFEVCA